jgi:nicotinamide-nucleotide amidase
MTRAERPAPHSDELLAALARDVGARLARAQLTVVTAESCTGGWTAKLLTDIPGSSAWFDCGFVTYSTTAKERDLGVSAATITGQGAVSEPAVREMAQGALQRTKADIAVAISGIAGPSGAVPGKPVGTVWFAVAQRHGMSIEVNCRVKFFKGDRDLVRRKSVEFALGLIRALDLPKR